MPTLKGKTLLKGHTLMFEGRPLGYRSYPSPPNKGIAGCSCGARSEELSTNAARKRWHKAHKDAIRAELKEG